MQENELSLESPEKIMKSSGRFSLWAKLLIRSVGKVGKLKKLSSRQKLNKQKTQRKWNESLPVRLSERIRDVIIRP